MKSIITTLSLLSSLIFLSGCAFISEDVRVCYVPCECSSPVANAAGSSVEVYVTDVRMNKKKVGAKTGEYGQETATFTLASDLSSCLKEAIDSELTSLGFKLAPGKAYVHIDIESFQTEMSRHLLSINFDGALMIKVSVQDANMQTIFTQSIVGRGDTGTAFNQSGSNAQLSLQNAFNDAVTQLINHQGFINALLRANQN